MAYAKEYEDSDVEPTVLADGARFADGSQGIPEPPPEDAAFDDDAFDDDAFPDTGTAASDASYAGFGDGYRGRSGGQRRGYGRRQRYADDEDTFDRPIPSAPEAEEALLGAVINRPATVIPDISDVISPEDFYKPAHHVVYETMLDLYSEGMGIDVPILKERLERTHNLERVGGVAYLTHLQMNTPVVGANARYHAHIVAEKAVLRSLIEAGTRVVQLGYEGGEGSEIEQVIDHAQQEVFAVGKKNSRTDYSRLRDLLHDVHQELSDIRDNEEIAQGVPTGFVDLDNILHGLHGGQMIIIAARPGVGKSTLALDFLRHCAIKKNRGAVLFSLEMAKSEIVTRCIAAEAGVKLASLTGGTTSDEDWDRVARRIGSLEDAPLFIDDSSNLTLMEIRSKARQLKEREDIQLIVVDYLQLLTSGKRVESRQQEVSEFSRQLKLLAKELDVPVVALSQLNRGPENRQDKKPQLADLRESGSLEQDADIVLLIYRPAILDDDNDHPRSGGADIIIAKHRGGPVGTVEIADQLHYSRFVDQARVI